MALKETWLPLRLSRGVDTEANPKILEPGTPTEALNVTFDERVTMAKRPGYERLDRTIAGLSYSRLSGAIGLSDRDDERDLVVLESGDGIFSRVGDRWVRRGDWVFVRQDSLSLSRRGYEGWDHTTASTGSVRVVAWEDARGGVYAQLADDETGVSYTQDFRIGGSGGRQPRAIYAGLGNLHVYFTSGSTLNVGVISAATPTLASATLHQIAADFYPTDGGGRRIISPYDVVQVGGSRVAVGWAASGAIRLGYVSPAGVLDAFGYPSHITVGAGVDTAAGSGPSLAVSPDQSQISVTYLYAGFTPLTNRIYRSNDLTVLVDATTLDNTTVNGSPTGVPNFVSMYDPRASNPNVVYCLYEVTSSSGLSADSRVRWSSFSVNQLSGVVQRGHLIHHSQLASKPFSLSGTMAAWVLYNEPTGPTEFLVRVPDGYPFGISRAGACYPDVSGALSAPDVVGAVAYRAATHRDLTGLPGTSGSSSVLREGRLLRTEYHPNYCWRPVDVDGVLFMPGGWLGSYDGAQVVEHGFLPAVIESISVGSGTTGQGTDPWHVSTLTALGTGTVVYEAVPEWSNARGWRDQGDSIPYTVTVLASQNSASLSIRTQAHTAKDGTHAPPMGFGIYRTAVVGSVLQRVGYVPNDVTQETVTFNDTFSEAQRGASEQLYTTAENPNSMPPAPKYLASAGDRLYLAGLEGAPTDIAASKLRLGGAVSFVDGEGPSVDGLGGDITGLAANDANLLIAKRTRMFVTPADGPSNAAADSRGWPVPEFLTTDIGAPDPSTMFHIAGQTEQGVMVKTERGFRSIDRSETSKNVGALAKGYDGLTVVGGASPRLTEEARFYTAEGTHVVFNTRFDYWSTHSGRPAVGSAVWDGRPAYASPDGHVYVEDTGSYRDGSDAYGMSITTGWISLEGVQGLQRVYRLYLLMDYKSPHTIRVSMARDYRDSWTILGEVPTSSSLNVGPYGGPPGYGSGSFGGTDSQYQLRFDIPINVQLMQSIRLKIEDVAQSGSGQSFTVIEAKLLGGVASQKAGLPVRKKY